MSLRARLADKSRTDHRRSIRIYLDEIDGATDSQIIRLVDSRIATLRRRAAK